MTMRTLTLAWVLFGAVAQVQAQAQDDDTPEVTDDGLMRVPSARKAGVYRLPTATFDQYRSVLFDPIKIEFKKGWEHNHREMSRKDLERLRSDLAAAFRQELKKELVKRGGFTLVDKPSPDTLRVSGQLLDTDVTAPKASSSQFKTYVRNAGSMKVIVELHDADSGLLIGRIISYETAPDKPEDVVTAAKNGMTSGLIADTQISNIADFRLGFENSARYTHEAINVARSAKREEQSRIKSDNE